MNSIPRKTHSILGINQINSILCINHTGSILCINHVNRILAINPLNPYILDTAPPCNSLYYGSYQGLYTKKITKKLQNEGNTQPKAVNPPNPKPETLNPYKPVYIPHETPINPLWNPYETLNPVATLMGTLIVTLIVF